MRYVKKKYDIYNIKKRSSNKFIIHRLQDKNNKSESLCIKKVLSQCYSNLLNVQKLKEWTCCNIAHQQLMEENTIDMKNISVNLVFNF